MDKPGDTFELHHKKLNFEDVEIKTEGHDGESYIIRFINNESLTDHTKTPNNEVPQITVETEPVKKTAAKHSRYTRILKSSEKNEDSVNNNYNTELTDRPIYASGNIDETETIVKIEVKPTTIKNTRRQIKPRQSLMKARNSLNTRSKKNSNGVKKNKKIEEKISNNKQNNKNIRTNKKSLASNGEYDKINTKQHCTVCDKLFDTFEYKEHLISTHCVIIYQCILCKKSIKDENDFLSHIITHEYCGCRACNINFNDYTLLTEHKRLVHDKFKPLDCDRSLISRTGLAKHKGLHIKELLYNCKMCEEKFQTKYLLDKHSLTHEELDEKATNELINDLSDINDDKNEIKVELNESFDNISDDNVDKPDIIEFDIKPATPEFGSKNDIDPDSTSDFRPDDKKEYKYECSVCKYTAKSVPRLKSHLQSNHSLPLPYKCKCGKEFGNIINYNNHKRLHSSARKFKCNVCRSAYHDPYSLKRHSLIHLENSERPFQCDICKDGFTRRRDLILHMKRHEAKKFINCLTCNKLFKSQRKFRKHLREHRDHKLYVCTLCGMGFKKRCTLDSHRYSHKTTRGHLCPVCGSTFVQSGQLNIHMRTHSDERPYVCKICNKTYRQSSHLKRHEFTHRGIQPYPCEVCGKCFSQRGNMKVHLKRVHSKVLDD